MAKFPNIKTIAAAALCCIPCGWAAYAADGAQKPAAQQTAPAARQAFEGKIYVSIQDPSMEWWFNVPAYAAPHISEIKKIFFNQEFSLFPFAENAKVRDGKFSISYSITMKTPDGTLRELVRDAKFSGTKIADNIIVPAPTSSTSSSTNAIPTDSTSFRFPPRTKFRARPRRAKTICS